MDKCQKWIFAEHFDGVPKLSDFLYEEEELPEPDVKNGEILCEAIVFSVDPYLRRYTVPLETGDVVVGQQVARITDSEDPDWPKGMLVLGFFGWRTHTIINVRRPGELDKVLYHGGPNILQRLPEGIGDLSPSLALGTLGMPGATAYFGIVDVLQMKPGETLFVNTAAGGVGHIVGQIGKNMSCKVIGCTGTEEKCSWLRELGFDYVFNYKTCDLSEELRKGAPDGIDCYFDNVGGHFTSTVISKHMRMHGRIVIAGTMATYNDSEEIVGPYPWRPCIRHDLTIKGMRSYEWYDRFPTAFSQLIKWIKSGQIKTREHVIHGFKNLPNAFLGLFSGDNIGKTVVYIDKS